MKFKKERQTLENVFLQKEKSSYPEKGNFALKANCLGFHFLTSWPVFADKLESSIHTVATAAIY